MNALLAILNVFIDPAETVRRIKGNKLAWLSPVVLGGLIMAFYNWSLTPFTIMAVRADPPPGVDPAKLDQMVGAMQMVSRFSSFTAPMMYALMTVIGAALIFAACVVLTINVRFPDIFNLVAHVGLINSLQQLAHYFVLKGKGQITSMKELMPSFGLELLLPDDLPKMLHGALSFLSFFTVWHIVMLAIGFAALAEIGKGKAFLATMPSWVLWLIFASIAAMFR